MLTWYSLFCIDIIIKAGSKYNVNDASANCHIVSLRMRFFKFIMRWQGAGASMYEVAGGEWLLYIMSAIPVQCHFLME